MVETVTYTSYLKDYMGPALKKMGNVGRAAISKVDTNTKKLTTTLRRGAAGVDHLRTRLNTLSGSSRMLGGLTRQMMGFASVFLLFRQGTDSLRKFDEQAKADIQVKAALASTNNAAGRTFEQLTKQASDLQKVTLFGDEETEGAQALLLTFKQIKTEMFDQTIPVIQDVATAMKMDLKAASLQVGKALNDPTTGLSMLTRVGITFSDEQKAVIKSLQKTGDMAGAQAVILKELESQFGGSARAAALAGMGPFKQVGMAFNDAKEGVGELINGGLKPLLPHMWSAVDAFKSSIAWMKEHKTTIKAVVTGLLVGGAAFLVIKGGVMAAALATKIWTIAQLGLNAAFKANPIGFIIAAIAAVTTGVIYAWNKFEGFRKFLYSLWETAKTIFANIKNAVLNVFGGIGKILQGVFTGNWNVLKSGLKDLGKGIIGGNNVFKGVSSAWEKGAEKGAASFHASLEKKAQQSGGFGVNGNFTASEPEGGGGLGLGLGGVSGSGKSVRNVTINLGSLIGENTNVINNVTDPSSDLSAFNEMLKRSLLTIVNDANLAGQ